MKFRFTSLIAHINASMRYRTHSFIPIPTPIFSLSLSLLLLHTFDVLRPANVDDVGVLGEDLGLHFVLVAAYAFCILGEGGAEDAHGQQRRVGRVIDADRRAWHAARHLYDREQAVQPVQLRRPHWHPNHGDVDLRVGLAGRCTWLFRGRVVMRPGAGFFRGTSRVREER